MHNRGTHIFAENRSNRLKTPLEWKCLFTPLVFPFAIPPAIETNFKRKHALNHTPPCQFLLLSPSNQLRQKDGKKTAKRRSKKQGENAHWRPYGSPADTTQNFLKKNNANSTYKSYRRGQSEVSFCKSTPNIKKRLPDTSVWQPLIHKKKKDCHHDNPIFT